MFTGRPRVLAFCAIWGLFASGCAGGPYQYGRGWRNAPPAESEMVGQSSPEIQEGEPNRFVDGVGWVVGIPGKLLLWDRRVNNHDVSEETTEAVAEYIERNQLDDVCVRVNQYAPGDEWRRLRDNTNVGAGWRYTLGTLSLVGYTLIPGRLVGGDHYNPYTNSVYIYSDVPALAIQSAAYAKDVQDRSHPGTYAAMNALPLVSIWHETINTSDALAYVHANGTDDQRVEAVRVLHPYYGMRVGGAVGSVAGPQALMVVGGAVAGHVSGWINEPRDFDDGAADSTEQTDSNQTISAVSLEETTVGETIARGQQASATGR